MRKHWWGVTDRQNLVALPAWAGLAACLPTYPIGNNHHNFSLPSLLYLAPCFLPLCMPACCPTSTYPYLCVLSFTLLEEEKMPNSLWSCLRQKHSSRHFEKGTFCLAFAFGLSGMGLGLLPLLSFSHARSPVKLKLWLWEGKDFTELLIHNVPCKMARPHCCWKDLGRQGQVGHHMICLCFAPTCISCTHCGCFLYLGNLFLQL